MGIDTSGSIKHGLFRFQTQGPQIVEKLLKLVSVKLRPTEGAFKKIIGKGCRTGHKAKEIHVLVGPPVEPVHQPPVWGMRRPRKAAT